MSVDQRSDEEVQLLAEFAALTGMSADEALVCALRRELERARAARHCLTSPDLAAAAERVTRHLTLPLVDHGDLLYGDDGLPK